MANVCRTRYRGVVSAAKTAPNMKPAPLTKGIVAHQMPFAVKKSPHAPTACAPFRMDYVGSMPTVVQRSSASVPMSALRATNALPRTVQGNVSLSNTLPVPVIVIAHLGNIATSVSVYLAAQMQSPARAVSPCAAATAQTKNKSRRTPVVRAKSRKPCRRKSGTSCRTPNICAAQRTLLLN